MSLSTPARPAEELPATPPRPGPSWLGADPAARLGWSFVWLAVLTGGLSLWGSWTGAPRLALLAPLVVFLGTAGLVTCWVLPRIQAGWFAWAGLAGAAAAAGLPAAAAIHARRWYTTDSAAFDHVAARILVAGHDPYAASMAAATRLLRLPAYRWTYTVNGGHVLHMSYPAGSFLPDAAAMLLGFHHMVVDWVDLDAWLLTGLLVFLLVPRRLRWLAPLLLTVAFYVGAFSDGGTDALFMPLLVVTVWRWDRFAQTRGPTRYLGPVCLGLACSMKQLPWFCVPFLLVGTFHAARQADRPAARSVASYAAAVGGAFAVVNLPFAVADFGAWWHASLLPLTQPLVANGQGLVTLATHGLTGGVDLGWLTVTGACVYLATVALFTAYPERLGGVWPLFVPAALFFTPRSLSSYLVDLVPPVLVAALTVPPRRADRRRRAGWLGPSLLGGVGTAAAALAFTSVPLAITPLAVTTTQDGHLFATVTVRITNHTAAPLDPHVTVDVGSGGHGYWSPVGGGLLRVGPGRSLTATLRPPVGTGAPSKGSAWLVEAYTSRPRALSTSAVQEWRQGQ